MAHQPGLMNACRLAVALPSAISSFCVVLVLFGWLGSWVGLAVLGWLGLGGALLTRPGERTAVLIGCRFRRPSAQQAAVLTPPWARALAHADLRDDQLDLYVHPSRAVNAFASGARSIAVTQGALEAFRTKRLQEAHLVAILVHEIGHLERRSTRYALATAVLTAPSEVLARAISAFAMTVAARQPRRMVVLVSVTGICIATATAAREHSSATALLLGCLPLAAVVTCAVRAALSRWDEYGADRLAARLGVGGDLAGALEALDHGELVRPWFIEMVSAHPDITARIDRLKAAASGGVV